MTRKTHKEWVEELIEKDEKHTLPHPLDYWIELALYCEEEHINNMLQAVRHAVKRMKFELENTPARWVHVREKKISQLGHWVALQDKLMELSNALNAIPM